MSFSKIKGGWAVLALLGLLAQSRPLVAAAGCAPTSASISYEADDYLTLYLNGNVIVDGTQFDQHPGTNTINPAFFSAAGSANYFAAKLVNSVPASVGAAWAISMVCADGSLSYITSSDSSFTMYDDLSGSTPPPPNGAIPWYQNAWVDSGGVFSGPPFQAPVFSWMTPFLTDPSNGATLPLLSGNSAGNQNSAAEIIYFRENITLPEITLTPTPTAYPTVCGTTPSFVSSQVLNSSGCTGSGNPTSWSFNVPAGPGEVLIVNVENGGGGTISGVTWNGVAMAPLPSNSAVSITGGGTLYTYYMVNPAAGSFLVAPTGINGCGWNVAATLYQNVDTSNALGAVSTHGGNNATFTESITTNTPYSIIHDFFAYPSGPATFTGAHGTQLFAASASACCDDVWGTYTNSTAPGTYNNLYGDPGGATNWTGVSVELQPVTSCGTPTPVLSPSSTPSFTPSPVPGSPTATRTLTPSPTATRSITIGPSPTNTPTPSATRTITATWTPSPVVTTPVPAPPGVEFKIISVYPNPATKAGCSIVVTMPFDGDLLFKLYDLRGELVWSGSEPGQHKSTQIYPWGAVNQSGAAVSYGAYYLTAHLTNGSMDASDQRWLTVVR